MLEEEKNLNEMQNRFWDILFSLEFIGFYFRNIYDSALLMFSNILLEENKILVKFKCDFIL